MNSLKQFPGETDGSVAIVMCILAVILLDPGSFTTIMQGVILMGYASLTSLE